MDHGLPKNAAPMIIQRIKSTWSDIRCIVLVNEEQERQKVVCAGADLIIIKGLPGSKLVTEIEKFLLVEEEDHPMSKDFDGE